MNASHDDTSRIIDGHAHVGTWREPGFAGRATTFADAVALYRGLGYRGALLTTTDVGDNAALLEELRRHDGSPCFRLAWWVDPTQPDALAALGAALPEVAALKVHPSFLRRPITDPELRSFLALAGDAELPVVVHCGRWREIAGWERSLEAAERHPRTRFVLSHMGGDEPLLVRGVVAALRERGLDNVWLGTESLRQYWVIQEAVDALGAERIVFGSDYNLNHPAAFRAIVDGLTLSREDRGRVLGGNIDALLPPQQRFIAPGEREV